MATVFNEMKLCIKKDRENGYQRNIGGLILNVTAFNTLTSELTRRNFKVVNFLFREKVVEAAAIKINKIDYILIILGDDDPIILRLFEITHPTDEEKQMAKGRPVCLMCCIDKNKHPIF